MTAPSAQVCSGGTASRQQKAQASPRAAGAQMPVKKRTK